MNIIYVSSGCSEEKFEQLRKLGITRKLPQAQKYHQLMVEGLACTTDGSIDVISAIPTNRSWSKKYFFNGEQEEKDNIVYYYISFVNVPLFSQISKYYSAKKIIKRICKSKDNVAIVCDVLNQSIADAAKCMGNHYNIPVIGIVTDVPGHTSGARRKSYSFVRRKVAEFAEKNSARSLGKYDAYLLLTEAMNCLVNKNGKPYIVLEGHCDSKMVQKENSLSIKCQPKIAMYAGGIHKEFGIERLVNAFVRGNFEDWELHIYGDGNYQEELTNLAKIKPNIKYFGVQPNSVIVENQLKASLLLNPRLTDAEYVKYSFPSKTLECMASGTPLCSTRLPGMPNEYYPYVYFFDDESEDGMLKTLQYVFRKDEEELHKFGKKAKDFVMTEKTNVKQAKKLLDFISTVLNL